MKRFFQKSIVAAVPLLLFSYSAACAQDQSASGGAPLDTLEKRASYAIGMNFAQSMKSQKVPIDLELLIQGMRDAFGDGEPRMSQQEIQQAFQEFQSMMGERQKKEHDEQAAANQKQADEFFAENKSKPGVVTTDSGLQYMVMREGDGPKPTLQDRVSVHYTGTLLDGTKFDSSYDRNQPATFPVGGVISGWKEAIQLMPVGSKYKLWIPPDLAYGANGQGQVIGPNAALVFEVELLGIEDASSSGNAGGNAGASSPHGGGAGGSGG